MHEYEEVKDCLSLEKRRKTASLRMAVPDINLDSIEQFNYKTTWSMEIHVLSISVHPRAILFTGLQSFPSETFQLHPVLPPRIFSFYPGLKGQTSVFAILPSHFRFHQGSLKGCMLAFLWDMDNATSLSCDFERTRHKNRHGDSHL